MVRDFQKKTNTFIDPEKQIKQEEREKEYDLEMLNSMGIKTPNIYENLETIKTYNGTRKKPLCKQLYKFNNSLN